MSRHTRWLRKQAKAKAAEQQQKAVFWGTRPSSTGRERPG